MTRYNFVIPQKKESWTFKDKAMIFRGLDFIVNISDNLRYTNTL